VKIQNLAKWCHPHLSIFYESAKKNGETILGVNKW